MAQTSFEQRSILNEAFENSCIISNRVLSVALHWNVLSIPCRLIDESLVLCRQRIDISEPWEFNYEHLQRFGVYKRERKRAGERETFVEGKMAKAKANK